MNNAKRYCEEFLCKSNTCIPFIRESPGKFKDWNITTKFQFLNCLSFIYVVFSFYDNKRYKCTYSNEKIHLHQSMKYKSYTFSNPVARMLSVSPSQAVLESMIPSCPLVVCWEIGKKSIFKTTQIENTILIYMLSPVRSHYSGSEDEIDTRSTLNNKLIFEGNASNKSWQK